MLCYKCNRIIWQFEQILEAHLSPELLQVHIFYHDPWEEMAHGLPTFLHLPENSGQQNMKLQVQATSQAQIVQCTMPTQLKRSNKVLISLVITEVKLFYKVYLSVFDVCLCGWVGYSCHYSISDLKPVKNLKWKGKMFLPLSILMGWQTETWYPEEPAKVFEFPPCVYLFLELLEDICEHIWHF